MDSLHPIMQNALLGFAPPPQPVVLLPTDALLPWHELAASVLHLHARCFRVDGREGQAEEAEAIAASLKAAAVTVPLPAGPDLTPDAEPLEALAVLETYLWSRPATPARYAALRAASIVRAALHTEH